MKQRSKRYQAIASKIEAGKKYSIADAFALLQEGKLKFDAGVELHLNLGIDASKSDQIVRSTVVMPHGTGKETRVAAFVNEGKVDEAKEAGADLIGDESVIEEIKKTGKCDFDVAVATPDMMRQLGPIAKTLGQQGLMPSPKTDTVGEDIARMVKELKGGKTAYRSDDGGNVHLLVGRASFTPEQIAENIETAMESVRKAKPADAKGTYVVSATLAASMSPGILLDIQ